MTDNNDYLELKKIINNVLGIKSLEFNLKDNYDPNISFEDNKRIVLKKLRLFTSPKVNITKFPEMKVLDSKKDFKLIYKDLHRAVSKVAQGFSTVAFIEGRGGTGKSFQIRQQLVKEKVNFFEFNGDVTEAYLYRLFYEHNGKIIWFRDVSKVLNSLGALNKLKAATETDKKRLLTKSSYSKLQKNLPDSFEFKGRIIFDYNTLDSLPSKLRKDFEALMTRGDLLHFSLSNEDVKFIMLNICKEPWEKEVTKYLISKSQSNHKLLNLRTQWHAFNNYKYAQANKLDWKSIINDEVSRTNNSKIRTMIYNFIGNDAIRSGEFAKILIHAGIFNSLTTARRRIRDWVDLGEIHKLSNEKRNYFISLSLLTKKKL